MKKKYFVGWIADAKGNLAPFIWSLNRHSLIDALADWMDRQTAITHVSEDELLKITERNDVQIRGLKRV